MRRARNAMYATLAIVGLVTLLAVAIALLRADGEGEHDVAEDDDVSEASINSPATALASSAVGTDSGFCASITAARGVGRGSRSPPDARVVFSDQLSLSDSFRIR